MDAEEYSKRADKHFGEKNFDEAIADFTEVIKLEPDNPFAYNKRGMSYINKNECDLAIADFSEAIRIEPNKFGDFYVDRGTAYGSKGDMALAISDLEMAVKIDPKKKEYQEILDELKRGKTSGGASISGPAAELKKRRIVLLVVTGIGLIAGAIVLCSGDYRGHWLEGSIVGGLTGAFFGVLLGFGIVPWLEFAKKGLKKIPIHFKTAFNVAAGIVN